MKKAIVIALTAALVGSAFAAAPAVAKKKKKKPKKPAVVQVDQKFFLRRDGCGTDADNTRLSLEDGADTGCWYVDAGILYELIAQAAANGAPFNPDVLWEPYPADSGVPLTLDASKPIGGEITFYGGQCVVDPVCSPVGISAGQATVRIRAIATIAGEDVELGTFEDSFTAVPGSTHTSKVEIAIDPALNGVSIEALRIEIFKGGAAYGPGGVEYDEPASFITVPAFVQG